MFITPFIKAHYENVKFNSALIQRLTVVQVHAENTNKAIKNVTHEPISNTLITPEEMEILRRAADICDKMQSNVNYLLSSAE